MPRNNVLLTPPGQLQLNVQLVQGYTAAVVAASI